jgi:hypothetical protein
MKRVIGLLVLSSLFLSSAALAQSGEQRASSVPTEFVDFCEIIVNGQPLRPPGDLIGARSGARFGSQLRVERSLVGQIQADTASAALK